MFRKMNVSRRSMPNICKKMKILTIAFLYLVSMMRFSLGRYNGIITIVFATFNSEFLHNMRCIAKTTRCCGFHIWFGSLYDSIVPDQYNTGVLRVPYQPCRQWTYKHALQWPGLCLTCTDQGTGWGHISPGGTEESEPRHWLERAILVGQ
jgi:hypothetical protein